jgi:transcriptional regulator with PAS, ATPase and Fis domain
MQVQVKLLRFLQEKVYRKLGSNTEESAKVKIIAATNKNLGALISAGKFRDDLYYRLNTINIEMPPLRDHKEDIPALISYFIKKFSKTINSISQQALFALTDYGYPGNTRELENLIERACIYCEGGGHTPGAADAPKEIGIECLPGHIFGASAKEIFDVDCGNEPFERADAENYMAEIAGIFDYINKKKDLSLPNFIEEIEKYITENRIKKENSKLEAAKSLGLSLRSLRYILSKRGNNR